MSAPCASSHAASMYAMLRVRWRVGGLIRYRVAMDTPGRGAASIGRIGFGNLYLMAAHMRPIGPKPANAGVSWPYGGVRMPVAGSKPPMSNCVPPHGKREGVVLPVGQRPAAGLVHAQMGVLMSYYSLSP